MTRVEVKLELGQLTEQVTVQASAVALQTDKSDVRSEVTSQAVGNLPLPAYRNFQNLIDLVPGATPANFQNSVGSTPARALTTNINGTASNSNNARADGAGCTRDGCSSGGPAEEPAAVLITLISA